MANDTCYRLWYQKPAPERYDMLDFPCKRDIANDGWEKWSLPIGNGYMGVCTFGRTTTERLQVTEHTLFNPQIGRCRLAVSSDRQVLSNGVEVPSVCENGTLSFDTVAGKTYIIQ